MRSLTRQRAAIVFCAFIGLALAQSWPLPRHLGTHLTGSPGGDTGVYVWNQWAFQHELVEQRRWPLFSDSIFAGDRPANLAHHNFTLAANTLALPLRSVFDVVTTFNLVWLINVALAGFGMFFLARRITTSDAEAWMAGAFFACSGFMVGRATGHFSLVAAAPLPFFVVALFRCWEYQRLRDAAWLGFTVAWALATDAYFGVYCILIGTGFLVARALHVAPGATRPPVLLRGLVICAMLALGVIAARLALGGGTWGAGPIQISLNTLYTPVFVLTLALTLRGLLSLRFWTCFEAWPARATAVRLAAVAVVVTLIAAAPILGAQAMGDAMESPAIFWRTGPRGADLLAFILPHWNHPWLPDMARGWLATHHEGLIEQSASFSPVFFLVLAFAAWTAQWRPSIRWTLMTVGFALMALGPFIHVAGINTHIPTPWTLLRYVPILGEARMPSRMAVVATMGAAMLLASALSTLTARWPHRRVLILGGTSLLLAVGLWPLPARLHSATVPSVYNRVAKDQRDVSVLVLPTGVRDGLRSLGNFSAESQFQQTGHGKRLVGGYQSRTSLRRRASHRNHPVIGALIAVGQGQALDIRAWADARNAAEHFVTDIQLAYVVIDHRQASPELVRTAVDLLRLTLVEREGPHSLYVTRLR